VIWFNLNYYFFCNRGQLIQTKEMMTQNQKKVTEDKDSWHNIMKNANLIWSIAVIIKLLWVGYFLDYNQLYRPSICFGEWHCESKVSCPKNTTQLPASQGSNQSSMLTIRPLQFVSDVRCTTHAFNIFKKAQNYQQNFTLENLSLAISTEASVNLCICCS